jgi:hypothetical protein
MIAICPRLSLARSRCGARRSSVRGIPGSASLPCCRINPRGQQQTRPARLEGVRRICTQQIAGHSIDRGCRCPCQVFSKCAGCSAAVRNPYRRRQRPCRRCDNRIGPRRSVMARRRGCFEMWAGRHERLIPRPSSGYNAARIGRDRSSVLRQRWRGTSRAETGHTFPVRRRQVVEPVLYTVEGRQAGDLRQK